jgi:hypothetical protein
MANVWTEYLSAKLRILWASHSSSEIAMILAEQDNVVFTRNAIVGKLHRMGMSMDDKVGTHPSTAAARGGRTRRDYTPVNVQSINRAKEVVVITPPPALPPCDHVDVEPLNIKFNELERADCKCRWPMEPDGQNWFFCGQVALQGPYCDQHRAIAFQPKPKKGFVPSKYAGTERNSYRLGGGRAA